MKKSITFKIFAVVLSIFTAVLLIQWLYISRSFNELFLNNMMSFHQKTLLNSIRDFSGGDENSMDPRLKEHFMETSSPVLVITENHNIVDHDFMSRMDIINVQISTKGTVNVATNYTTKMDNPPSFIMGRRIQLRAVRLGNSSYYEPLTINFGDTAYTNKERMKEYKLEDTSIVKINDYGIVSRVNYILTGSSTRSDTTVFIYEQMKDCLIRFMPVSLYLENLSAKPIKMGSSDYQIYWEMRIVEGDKYYFITARKLIVATEDRYNINRFLYSLYGQTAVFLIAAAWVLSRYITKPLIKLSYVTRQISRLDFSNVASVKSQDEFGRLSNSINAMSQKLQIVISELNQKNAELLCATDAAKNDEARMKKLLSDLAHEFKTPLFIISSHLEALETGISVENTDKFFSIINNEVSRLSDMVDEAIELSKIQRGNRKIIIEKWDIKDIILATVDKFEKRFKYEGFTVTASIEDAIVFMDARCIEQVLTNFFSNAIKYTNERKRIDIISRAEKERIITIYVGNSGYLTELERRRIWERYYTSNPQDGSRLPSEGIGLDIVRNILEAHGSEYGVKLIDGMVYFYFTLKME